LIDLDPRVSFATEPYAVNTGGRYGFRATGV
jgi:hypothetical protein